MIIETTPERITKEIIKLCKEINSNEEPLYIRVNSEEWCENNDCFINVKRKIDISRGRQVNGWAIWQWANRMIEAEAHAVWENVNGELLDITPHERGENYILFLQDENVIYNGRRIPNKRVPLTKSPLVQRLIEIEDEIDMYKCNSESNSVRIPQILSMELAKIQKEMNQEVKGLEFCPCQSGLKYKKCCGKYEKKV